MKIWSAGEYPTSADLNANFNTSWAYLTALTWANANTAQYYSLPAGYDEILVVYEFYQESGSSTTIKTLMNQITTSNAYIFWVPAGSGNSNASYLPLNARNGSAGIIGAGSLTFKVALFKSNLFFYGGSASFGNYMSVALEGYVPAAGNLTRLDFNPDYAVTGTVRIYGRKYS